MQFIISFVTKFDLSLWEALAKASVEFNQSKKTLTHLSL